MPPQSPLELFWISGSPYAWRVQLALEVKRLPYASRLLDASKGDLKTPQYLALNPRGQAPTLKDGDDVLTESLAILVYLDRKYPQAPLFGADARESARIWRLISEYLSYLDRPAGRVITPIYSGKIAENRDDIRAAVPRVHAELALLEGNLGAAPWLGGDALCAADLAIYPFIKSLLRAAGKEAATPLDLGLLPFEARYPRLAAWAGRVEQLPGYQNTYPPHWRQQP
jgi:glutathione S-transferase